VVVVPSNSLQFAHGQDRALPMGFFFVQLSAWIRTKRDDRSGRDSGRSEATNKKGPKESFGLPLGLFNGEMTNPPSILARPALAWSPFPRTIGGSKAPWPFAEGPVSPALCRLSPSSISLNGIFSNSLRGFFNFFLCNPFARLEPSQGVGAGTPKTTTKFHLSF
jgi:hypothetical protein